MCNTNWCYGECDECVAQAEAEFDKQMEEANAECPHRKECNWVVTDVKNDRCTTCGQTFSY